eukprot:scpid15754/ scgid5356/ 1-phosphatidylinositol 3-phosphate 5-kinase; FYVE finger-containing phosphoinositide kinase; PIKfyve; Phosphatidylinositol 3-phosphate 5-kinase type III; p235
MIGQSKSVLVTSAESTQAFYCQVSPNPKLDTLMSLLREAVLSLVPGTFKAGDICCAQFTEDQEWYRARVVAVTGDAADVLYLDYGNSETVPLSGLRALPAKLMKLAPQAKLCSLARGEDDDEWPETAEVQQAFLDHVLSGEGEVTMLELDQAGLDGVTPVQVWVNGSDIAAELGNVLSNAAPPQVNGHSHPPAAAAAVTTASIPAIKLTTGSILQVSIAHVESMSRFSCQLMGTRSRFEELEVNLYRLYNKPVDICVLNASQITAGTLCCVHSDMYSWCRARVEKVRGESVDVVLVDYGSPETVQKSGCWELCAAVCDIEAQCFVASLSCGDNGCSDDLKTPVFKSLVTDGKKLQATILSLPASTDHNQSIVVNLQDEKKAYISDLLKRTCSANDSRQAVSIGVEQIPLATVVDKQTYEVVVVLDDPSEPNLFQCQLVENAVPFEEVQRKLTEVPAPALSRIEPGQLCIGCSSQDKVPYRAMIESESDGTCQIVFLDFGDRESIPAEFLRELPPDLCKYPRQAIPAMIHSSSAVQPADLRGCDDHVVFSAVFAKRADGRYDVRLSSSPHQPAIDSSKATASAAPESGTHPASTVAVTNTAAAPAATAAAAPGTASGGSSATGNTSAAPSSTSSTSDSDTAAAAAQASNLVEAFSSKMKKDCLDPRNHQRITVCFSTDSPHSPNAPEPCILPWVVNMEFFGKNDVCLGEFLRRYCFRENYLCVNALCGLAMLHHARHFVHGNATVHITVDMCPQPLPDRNENSIFGWSACSKCSRRTYPMMMSMKSLAYSLGKFLEMLFYANASNGDDREKQQSADDNDYAPASAHSGASDCKCKHTAFHDSVLYFGCKDQVAIFEYSNIALLEVIVPPILIVRTGQATPELAVNWNNEFHLLAKRINFVYSSLAERLEELEASAADVRIYEVPVLRGHCTIEQQDFLSKLEALQEEAMAEGMLRKRVQSMHTSRRARIRNRPTTSTTNISSDKVVTHQGVSMSSTTVTASAASTSLSAAMSDEALSDSLNLLRSSICARTRFWNQTLLEIFRSERHRRALNKSSTKSKATQQQSQQQQPQQQPLLQRRLSSTEKGNIGDEDKPDLAVATEAGITAGAMSHSEENLNINLNMDYYALDSNSSRRPSPHTPSESPVHACFSASLIAQPGAQTFQTFQTFSPSDYQDNVPTGGSSSNTSPDAQLQQLQHMPVLSSFLQRSRSRSDPLMALNYSVRSMPSPSADGLAGNTVGSGGSGGSGGISRAGAADVGLGNMHIADGNDELESSPLGKDWVDVAKLQLTAASTSSVDEHAAGGAAGGASRPGNTTPISSMSAVHTTTVAGAGAGASATSSSTISGGNDGSAADDGLEHPTAQQQQQQKRHRASTFAVLLPSCTSPASGDGGAGCSGGGGGDSVLSASSAVGEEIALSPSHPVPTCTVSAPHQSSSALQCSSDIARLDHQHQQHQPQLQAGQHAVPAVPAQTPNIPLSTAQAAAAPPVACTSSYAAASTSSSSNSNTPAPAAADDTSIVPRGLPTSPVSQHASRHTRKPSSTSSTSVVGHQDSSSTIESNSNKTDNPAHSSSQRDPSSSSRLETDSEASKSTVADTDGSSSQHTVALAKEGKDKKAAGIRHWVAKWLAEKEFQPLPHPFGSNIHFLPSLKRELPVVIHEDEPSSIIAFMLSSDSYQQQLANIQALLNSSKLSKDSAAGLPVVELGADAVNMLEVSGEEDFETVPAMPRITDVLKGDSLASATASNSSTGPAPAVSGWRQFFRSGTSSSSKSPAHVLTSSKVSNRSHGASSTTSTTSASTALSYLDESARSSMSQASATSDAWSATATTTATSADPL